MNNFDSKNRLSDYALWEDLYQVLLEDAEQNASISSYSSPTITSCLNWMKQLGEAIRTNDKKAIERYMYNISYRTAEAINAKSNGQLQGVSEDWMKPYYEFSQAAQILTLRIDYNLQ